MRKEGDKALLTDGLPVSQPTFLDYFLNSKGGEALFGGEVTTPPTASLATF